MQSIARRRHVSQAWAASPATGAGEGREASAPRVARERCSFVWVQIQTAFAVVAAAVVFPMPTAIAMAVAAKRNGVFMLILTRRITETVEIGDDIAITILGIDRGQVKIGIDAPKTVNIRRRELAYREVEASAHKRRFRGFLRKRA